jgi:uncharacterized protein with HEPN domain
LRDIRKAVSLSQQFVSQKSREDYLNDPLLRSGVERQLMITGEALCALAKFDPSTAEKISEYRRIIAFRNIFIHGYSVVDDNVVWDILEKKLPKLHQEVQDLLSQNN